MSLFLTDKYAPTSIKDAKFHKELLQRLYHMSKDESIPHILFCGPEGSGKKTIIRMFLEMLFDSDVHDLEDAPYSVNGSGNKPVTVTIKQSNYHIVIEPNNNNFDRYLIQDIVKEYAKKIPFGVFKTKKIFKIVLINNVDNLSYYAQTSLRRTMEKYSSTCRFLMWCSSSSRVIEPLISRCIFLTISAPSNEEIFRYIFDIAAVKENIKLSLREISDIIYYAKGNIKEALWLLELHKYKYTKKNIYHHTLTQLTKIIIFHDIGQINESAQDMRNGLKKKLFVRDLLHNIMITNINGTSIMRDLLDNLCDNNDIPDECKYDIIELASKYEHNLIRGRRSIIHLETFVIQTMNILYEYGKKYPEHEKIFSSYFIEYDDDDDGGIKKKSTRGRKDGGTRGRGSRGGRVNKN